MDTMVRDPGATVTRPKPQRARRHATVGTARLDRAASTATEEPVERTPGERLRNAAILGGLIGFLVMGAAIYVMSVAAGADPAGALGVAAFCAIWGGLGFGSMLGAIANAAWEERREAPS